MAAIKKKIAEVESSLTTKDQTLSSRLGSSTKFKGELSCQEDVIIDGSFQGKIDSVDHSIYIDKEAIVKADIRGKNITVFGHVSGNISATDKIVIGKGALLTGDISAPRISIQEGSKFKGTVKMLPETR